MVMESKVRRVNLLIPGNESRTKYLGRAQSYTASPCAEQSSLNHISAGGVIGFSYQNCKMTNLSRCGNKAALNGVDDQTELSKRPRGKAIFSKSSTPSYRVIYCKCKTSI